MKTGIIGREGGRLTDVGKTEFMVPTIAGIFARRDSRNLLQNLHNQNLEVELAEVGRGNFLGWGGGIIQLSESLRRKRSVSRPSK